MAVVGFIRKPPPVGTQLVELSTFKDPQPIVEAITSSNAEAETKSEDSTSEENTESPIRDEDFKVFYRTYEIEEEASNSHLAATLISENQEATKILEPMEIKKRLPDLLSLLESQAKTTTPEVPIIPRPPTPIPPPPPQTEPADEKRKRDRKGGKGSIKEGEVQEDTPPEPTKVAKTNQA